MIYPSSERPDVAAGDWVILSPRVKLRIVRVLRTRKGDFDVRYELWNENLGERYLAVQGGRFQPEQYVHSRDELGGGQAIEPDRQEAYSRDSWARFAKAAGEVEEAARAVLGELEARAEASPSFRREGRAPIARIRRELDGLVERSRRRAEAA